MIALFGGSFNPVHFGHLILARDVLETLGLEKIVFVPPYLQPLKGELFIPPDVRLKLLKVSIKGEERFEVWDYEIRKGGVSYTVETLREFHRLYGEKPIFVMGADAFNSFYFWKEPEEILKLARILVPLRPGYRLNLEEVLGFNYPINCAPAKPVPTPGNNENRSIGIIIKVSGQV